MGTIIFPQLQYILSKWYFLLAFVLINRRWNKIKHTHTYSRYYLQPHTQTHLFQVHVFHETFSRSLEVRQFCLTNRGEETSSSVNATNSSSSTHTQTVRGFTGNGKRLDYNVRKKAETNRIIKFIHVCNALESKKKKKL